MRRRTAAAKGAGQAAVNYDFGRDGAPRSRVKQASFSPRVVRLRSHLTDTSGPARSPTHIPTVPIPPNRNSCEPLGASLLRPPGPPETPSATTAYTDALSASENLQKKLKRRERMGLRGVVGNAVRRRRG